MRILLIFAVCFTVILSANDPIRPITSDLPKISLSPEVSDSPYAQLDRIIFLTEKFVDEQKELRQMVQAYVNLHAKYKKNLEDRELSYLMVKQAHMVFSKIKELHLAYAFDQEFLSDLAFFSGIIERWEGLDSLSSTE